jgi:hypothetical protein
MIFGLGDIICKIFWIYVGNPMFIKEGLADWKGIFLVPAALSFIAALILLVAFHPKESTADLEVNH